LADGMLAVFLGKLNGLERGAGELRWTQRGHPQQRPPGRDPGVSWPAAGVRHTNGEIIAAGDGKLLSVRAISHGRRRHLGTAAILGNTCTWAVRHSPDEHLRLCKVLRRIGNRVAFGATSSAVPRELSLRADGQFGSIVRPRLALVHNGLA